MKFCSLKNFLLVPPRGFGSSALQRPQTAGGKFSLTPKLDDPVSAFAGNPAQALRKGRRPRTAGRPGTAKEERRGSGVRQGPKAELRELRERDEVAELLDATVVSEAVTEVRGTSPGFSARLGQGSCQLLPLLPVAC